MDVEDVRIVVLALATLINSIEGLAHYLAVEAVRSLHCIVHRCQRHRS